MADIDVGSPCKAARVIIVAFALSFISSPYVADSLTGFCGILLFKSSRLVYALEETFYAQLMGTEGEQSNPIKIIVQ